jgi:acyl carrier protein
MENMHTGAEDMVLRIKEIMVSKLGLQENQLIQEASFGNDLHIDSLDLIELHMDLEKEFNITIPDEEGEKLTTVGSVINYINRKVTH